MKHKNDIRNILRKCMLVLISVSVVLSAPSVTYAATASSYEINEEDGEEQLIENDYDDAQDDEAEYYEVVESLPDEDDLSDADSSEEYAGDEEMDMFEAELEPVPLLRPYVYDTINDYPEGYVPDIDDITVESELPSYYNRIADIMPSRNQGSYGTCWAHATMAAAEEYMVTHKNADADAIDYSERALAYFFNADVGNVDPLGGTVGDRNFRTDGNWTKGNNVVYVMRYLSGWHNIINESEAPYSGMPSSVSASKEYENEVVLTDARSYEADDRANIKKAIMEKGVVICNYCHDTSYYNSTYNSFYTPSYAATNHAVAIVGWDDNFEANKFKTTAPGNGAWLIRNSWSTGGRRMTLTGYFWMSYYDKTLCDYMSYDFAKADEYYDNNYMYDGAAMYNSRSYYESVTEANVFTAKANNGGKEVLKAVSFITENTNVNYTIDIYLNPPVDSSGIVTDPIKGTKVASATTKGMTSHAGLYSVPLANPVSLKAGDRFTVAVTFDKKGSFVDVEYEYDMSSYYADYWFTSKVGSVKGQSFILQNGSVVVSCGPSSSVKGNLRVKAFTDNAEDEPKPEPEPEPKSLTVRYVLNGGYNDMGNPDKYDFSREITLLNPVKTGYAFDGWYTDSSYTRRITKLTPDMADGFITIYAKWTKGKAIPPQANVPGGAVLRGSSVRLYSELPNAEIFYTTDGTNPDINNVFSYSNPGASTRYYDEEIVINANTCIKAVAIAPEYTVSNVMTVNFTVYDGMDWGDITEEDRAYMGFSTPDDVPYAYWVTGIEDVSYTGSAVTFPDAHVYYHDVLLKEKVDYNLRYSANINAGTASVTYTFAKNFYGTLKKTFLIRPLDLSLASVDDIEVASTGSVIKGKSPVSYVLNGKNITLKEGTDYTLVYGETRTGAYKLANADADPGYVVTVVGKKNYMNSSTQFLERIIDKKDITKGTFTSIKSQIYDGGRAVTPDVTVSYKREPLTRQTVTNGPGDYRLEYCNNIYPGTATVKVIGVNDFAGTKLMTFKIEGTSLTPVKLNSTLGGTTYTKITDRIYDGSAQKPGFELFKTINGLDFRLKGIEESAYSSLSDTEKLKYAYVYSYANNINAGTANVICTGVNGYTGTYKTTFKIMPMSLNNAGWAYHNPGSPSGQLMELDMAASYQYTKGGCKITPAIWTKIYKKPAGGEPGGYVYLKQTLGTDYTLSYEKNTAPGTAYLKITGKGSLKDSIRIPFKIVGGDIANASATATDVIYKKQAGICKPSIALVDTNGSKLTAGTDYDKNISYYYDKPVTVEQFVDSKKKDTKTVARRAGEKVDASDIIPGGAVIRADILGVNNYAGTQTSVRFGFAASNISGATVEIPTQYFTGRAITLSKDQIKITVNKQRLETRDFEIVSYSKNIAKGTATVVLRGKGNYGGLKNGTFKIIYR